MAYGRNRRKPLPSIAAHVLALFGWRAASVVQPAPDHWTVQVTTSDGDVRQTGIASRQWVEGYVDGLTSAAHRARQIVEGDGALAMVSTSALFLEIERRAGLGGAEQADVEAGLRDYGHWSAGELAKIAHKWGHGPSTVFPDWAEALKAEGIVEGGVLDAARRVAFATSQPDADAACADLRHLLTSQYGVSDALGPALI